MEQIYETYKANFQSVIESAMSQYQNRNEATTRLHLIDTLFKDCLGWDNSMIKLEDSYCGEYADYIFSTSRPILVVEAKKEGDYYTLPLGLNQIEYNLKTLYDGNPNLRQAVAQVAGYCQDRGIQYAAVCNGHQLVTFLATRVDGVKPLEGRALTFTSLDQMYVYFTDSSAIT